MAYHLFEFEYKGQRFELPNEEADPDELLDVAFFKLSQLRMSVGDKLKMVYDFGTEQAFHLELISIEPMPKGHGKHYPWIADGAGRGILDDRHVEEIKELVAQIDRNGRTDEPIYYHGCTVPWNYREFDIDITNALLKGEIEQIQEGYSPFWDICDEE